MIRSHERRSVRHLVMAALFAALTAVCAQLIIPIGTVPVSLSLLPMLVSAALLPLPDALAAAGVYLLLGLAGAPVFSGFTGGPARLLGPTGGYLIGYLPCVLCAGAGIRRFGRSIPAQALSMAAGVLICYAFGTVWYLHLSGQPPAACLSVCVLPFLPFDALKIAAACALSRRLYRHVP